MRNDGRTRAYVATRRQEGKSTREIMRCLKRYVAREAYDQLLHPRPAPDAGTLRTARTAKQLTLQQAADALHDWPTALSRLERGLAHDNAFHHRYETWLNCQPPGTVQMPDPGLARVLPA
jgi:hypothetical protein